MEDIPHDVAHIETKRDIDADIFGPLAWLTCRSARHRSPELFSRALTETLGEIKNFYPAVEYFVYQFRIEGEKLGVVSEVFSIADGAISRGAREFVAQEWAVAYRIRAHDVLHPGLFLDHARLRKKLLSEDRFLPFGNAKALNVFAFTGSFSVCLARRGWQTTTVDLSKKTLDWAQENFALNGLNPAAHFFVAEDALARLKFFQKKSISFSLVLCDPPSFSRSKNGVFKFADDFDELHARLFAVTAPGGILMTSANFKEMSVEDYRFALLDFARRQKRSCEILETLLPMPIGGHANATYAHSYMKGFLARLG